MPDRTSSSSQSVIRNFPIQRKISSHHMVLSSQAQSFFFGRSTPSKVFSKKKAEFLISRFSLKNGNSSSEGEKSLVDINLHHSKNNFDRGLSHFALCWHCIFFRLLSEHLFLSHHLRTHIEFGTFFFLLGVWVGGYFEFPELSQVY